MEEFQQELNLDSCPYCQSHVDESISSTLDDMIAYECGAVIKINMESDMIDTINCCEACIKR
jgi:hypothetical protein